MATEIYYSFKVNIALSSMQTDINLGLNVDIEYSTLGRHKINYGQHGLGLRIQSYWAR